MTVPITYFRSSSYNTHDFCPVRYFCEYVLGWTGPSNIKADKGTIVHKVLEILAKAKKANQEGKSEYFDNELNCSILANVLTQDIRPVVEIAYNYYKERCSHHSWTIKDFEDCLAWSKKVLDTPFDPRIRNIVDAEPHFHIKIDKPWAAYHYTVGGKDLKGTLHIKGTIDLITDLGDGVYEIIDWKGLPLDTPLPTPDGWTTMNKVTVGEKVFDQHGQQCRVIGKSQVTQKQCYKITFDDTREVTCDEDHLWKLYDGSVIKITDLKIGDTIPITKPLQIGDIDLPISPYVLGAWIGDGRNQNGEISNNDNEIYDKIRACGFFVGKNISGRNGKCQSRTVYKLLPLLRELTLLHNKHIPSIYLRSSYQQRLELLKGLMDTDGNANPSRKQACFTTISQQLSENVMELLISLGQRPNCFEVTRSTNFSDSCTYYQIQFRPININPFSLPRKKDRIDKKWGSGNSHIRRITNIKKTIIEKTQCIMVDSPDNTYLCTTNMIPTHNTGRRINWNTGQEKTLARLQTDPQLMLYYYAAKQMYPDAKTIIATMHFINDGGPYTIHFDNQTEQRVLDMLRRKFIAIRDCEKPRPKRSWKCSSFCHQGLSTFEGTGIEVLLESRTKQVTSLNEPMTMCEQVRYALDYRPVESIIANMSKPGFKLGYYKAPGSVE